MTCSCWKPVQFRIFRTQLEPLLTRVEANGRHAVPGSEVHRDVVEFGLMDADSNDQALFDRARAMRYSIYPGRRLGTANVPAIYWTHAFWQAEAAQLDQQIALMGEDRRLMLDIEAYGGSPILWSALSPGPSPFGDLAGLRAAMAPYLRRLAAGKVTLLMHPASLDQVLFTELADAVSGRVCAQYESTFGDEFGIYGDDARWKRGRHGTAASQIAPLRRRYPEARISHGYHDTIIRKYWFNRLPQLASVEDGHVFIDDQYKLDWNALGEPSAFDCTAPAYNMNEGVVEAYYFAGNTDHLVDSVTRGQRAVNIAVGLEDRKQLAPRCDGGYTHSGAMTLESGGRTFLIDRGTRLGLGYERALLDPAAGSGYVGTPFSSATFTILLDFRLSTLAGLRPTYARRNPLLSVWGSAGHGQRWFRVYYDPTNQYVFEVVERNNGAGRTRLTIDAGNKDDRIRRLLIVHSPGSLSLTSDTVAVQSTNYAFQSGAHSSLVLGYERHADAPEGDFYSATGLAFEQCVIWNRPISRLPRGSYPFMESQA